MVSRIQTAEAVCVGHPDKLCDLIADQILDDTIYNTAELETQQAILGERIAETITLINQLITTAVATAHDPDEYDRRYRQLEDRHQQLEQEH